MKVTAPDPPAGRIVDLLHAGVLAAFDRVRFEHDGYWVWESILTDAGRAQWLASLQRIQALNDAIVVGSNWGAIDFAARGLAAPAPESITPDALAGYCGGSEQMGFQPPGLRDYMYSQGLFDEHLAVGDVAWQGMMPEYFPLAYDDFMLDICTSHPQMLQLFSKVLGDDFLIDHVLTLNRPPGSQGRRWHGHPYRQGQHETEDSATGGTPDPIVPSRQCVRTLCYPEGMGRHDGGGELSVVPGAHLFRTPYMWDRKRSDYDEGFAAGWLQGKAHPISRKPLRIERLDLPPGSMVSFVHHMPHHVGHRDADAATRWGLLMAYRTRDPQAQPARWNEGTPSHWADRMAQAGELTPAMRRVFDADVPMVGL